MDNFPTWIRGRERMAVEIISWPNLYKRWCWTRGSNPGPPEYQCRPTDLVGPASGLQACASIDPWHKKQTFSIQSIIFGLDLMQSLRNKHIPMQYTHIIRIFFALYALPKQVLENLHKEVKINEPCHEKTCFCHMRTTKAQISLRIRAVWSASLLFAA